MSFINNGSFLVRIKICKFILKKSIYMPDIYTLLKDNFKDILQEFMEKHAAQWIDLITHSVSAYSC